MNFIVHIYVINSKQSLAKNICSSMHVPVCMRFYIQRLNINFMVSLLYLVYSYYSDASLYIDILEGYSYIYTHAYMHITT